MKIFKSLSTTLAILCFSSDLLSDITFYGKINTSYESTDKNSKTDTDFKNNASRLGIKGKFDLNENLKISYQFENEIERRFKDIVKYLKKEYKNVTNSSVNLTEVDAADIMVQSTSRVRNWVQATKQYKIGGAGETESLKKPSSDKMEDGIKKFLELSSDKRPKNDKAPKNPDTPKA